MSEIGIKELKAKTSAIIQEVRERGARYVVTHRGQPAGLLIPLEEPLPAAWADDLADGESAWQELLELGEAIGRGWKASETSTDLLSKMRR